MAGLVACDSGSSAPSAWRTGSAQASTIVCPDLTDCLTDSQSVAQSQRGRGAGEWQRSACGGVSTTIAAPSSALIARALRAPTEAPPEVVVDTTFGISVDAALPVSTYQRHFVLPHLLQPQTPAYAMPVALELSSARAATLSHALRRCPRGSVSSVVRMLFWARLKRSNPRV